VNKPLTPSIVVLALAAGLCASGPSRADEAKPALKHGEPAPMFFLYDTDGKMFFLREHCGPARKPKKAIIIDFFSTSCAPCKREMPHLASLYREHRDRGLSLVIVGFQQEAEVLRPYFKKNKFTDLPVLADIYGTTSKKYGVKSLPRTVVLDSKCRVKGIFDAKTKDKRKKLARTVKKLLPE